MRDPKEIKADLAKQIEGKAQFSRPGDAAYGDLTTNVALQLAAEDKSNPRETAQELAEKLELPEEISKVEVAGPGFINFTYSDGYLLDLLRNPEAILDNKTEDQTIVVDYSQPNVAKPLMAHHLLSTIIGQSVVNIFKAKGNKVVSVNYIGDWGTQFGKLIYAYRQWGDHDDIEKDPIPELLALYVRFHNEAEKDPELDERGREEFKKLEEGDPENLKLWEWIVEVSIREIERLYALLGGIKFDSYRAEAACRDDLPALIESGLKLGIFEAGEGGSLIVNLDAEGLIPFLVQKTDGTTLYSTRDLETVRYRLEEYKPNKIIYVVDVAQKLHFEQVFASVEKFPWYSPETDMKHLIFGRMRFRDGKMSTRKGNVIQLEEILEEAITRATKIIDEKNPDLENKEEVARQVGIGAVKYSIVSQSPESDLVFDWDKIISFEGNSAPYLQYSHARAASILRQEQPGKLPKEYNLSPEEALVIRDAVAFKHVIDEAAGKLKPNIIATYLYELSQNFNGFYTKCPVLSEENPDTKQVRLAIVSLFASLMKEGLSLLGGIEAPEQM